MTISPEPTQCPSSETLQALLAGNLAPEEERACEEHLSSCLDCQERLEGLVGGRQTFDNVAAVLEEEAQRPSAGETLVIGELYSPPHKIDHDWHAVLDPRREDAGSDAIGSCGRFDVHEYIASGGMGIVFKGYDSATARTVAIKVLAPVWASNAISRERFLREARAAAALSHENILPIFIVDDDGPYPFIVMPFVDGETLEQSVQRRGPLPFEEIRTLSRAITKGLAAAHAAGIIHRDLKPANILLQGEHKVLLADFGLARAKDTPELTIPGTIPGTPEFMAPEQIGGVKVDHRADLFALGCLLQFMATGKPPFQGNRVSQILQSVTSQEATKITRPHPSWFHHVLGQLLQKDPDLRPAEASLALDYFNHDGSSPPIHDSRRRTWPLVPGGIALITAILALTLTLIPDRIPTDTPVYIDGLSTRFDNLSSAIAAAPANATIILRDGLHEVPGELIVHQPLRFVAAEGARPLLRSRDTERGKVFDFKAEAELIGLTLHHVLTDPSKTKPLINTRSPLTLRHCRLEQRWNEPTSPNPFPATIIATDSVTLSHTEIEATNGCAILSRLQEDSPDKVSILLEECTMVAVRGFFFLCPETPKAWDITLSHCNLLTGGLFCINEKDHGVPHWKLDSSVIESSCMLMVRGDWQYFESKILPQATWEGRDNLYSFYRFLRPWEGGPESSLQQTLDGWLELCPGATDHGHHRTTKPIFVETLPEDHRGMRTTMLRMRPFTAMDLSLDDQTLSRFPQVGGSMSKVGPLATSSE